MKPLTFNSISCPTGNCHIAPHVWGQKSVDITDLDIKDSEHPNTSPFTGTLLLLDEPSDQPPHGSDGHQIFVPEAVAKKRLSTLPGMAVNYQDDLEGHNPTKKIGVITRAWLDGKKVKVEGTIWKKDFPEALRTFRMNRGRLGMSMELGDVYVRDKDEAVWHLEDFHFTGATILKKDHAAYESTELAASRYFVNALAAARSAVEVTKGKGGNPEMAEKKKKSSGQLLVAAISASVAKAIGESMGTFVTKQKETNDRVADALEKISASNEQVVKGLHDMALGEVSAGADDADDADFIDIEATGSSNPSDASDATMASARGDASDGSDPTADGTDPSDASDGTDMSDVDASVDTGDRSPQDDTGSGSTPGNLNPHARDNYNEQSKGPASSRISKTGSTGTSRGIAAARERGTFVARSMAAAKVIRSLTAQNQQLRETNKRFQNRVAALEASVSRYADRVERRTITPETASLLEKGGYDVRELFASKQRLSVNEVDELFTKSGIQLEPAMRAALKNQLLQAGLMEHGEVRRWN